VQSGIVTQLLIELTEKHPELLEEIKERLATLPYPVERYVFLEIRHRSHPYDLKELTKPWADESKTVQNADEVPIRSRRYIRRSKR